MGAGIVHAFLHFLPSYNSPFSLLFSHSCGFAGFFLFCLFIFLNGGFFAYRLFLFHVTGFSVKGCIISYHSKLYQSFHPNNE
ncbi:hypothetical protein HOY82DRAFT_136355 [Tuber indicum]|nr:hypothetical protein HOY82DRAFT_136355 [Tuber indicum]